MIVVLWLIAAAVVAAFIFDWRRQQRRMRAIRESTLDSYKSWVGDLKDHVTALEAKDAAAHELIVALKRGIAIRDAIVAARESTIGSQSTIIEILTERANVEGWEPPKPAVASKLN